MCHIMTCSIMYFCHLSPFLSLKHVILLFLSLQSNIPTNHCLHFDNVLSIPAERSGDVYLLCYAYFMLLITRIFRRQISSIYKKRSGSAVDLQVKSVKQVLYCQGAREALQKVFQVESLLIPKEGAVGVKCGTKT